LRVFVLHDAAALNIVDNKLNCPFFFVQPWELGVGMGAAASIADWGPLPVDCSDVADVEAARAEVGRLRSLIGELAIISNLFSALDWERTGSLNAPNCVEWLRSAASSSRSAQTKLCAHTLQAGLGADAWDGDAVSYDRWLAFWKAEKADGDIVDTLA
jgi:hypothetical protein